MTRVTYEEKLSVACPWCGAIPGAWCADRRGLSWLNHPHPQRREAFLRRKRVEEQQRNAEAARSEVYIARFGE